MFTMFKVLSKGSRGNYIIITADGLQLDDSPGIYTRYI